MLARLFESPRWQLVLLASYLFLNASITAVSQVADFARVNIVVNSWEPFVWEYSSAVFVFLLFPLILITDARFPLTRESLARAIPVHILASIVFSLLHVAGMVGLRKLIYRAAGSLYDFGDWPAELLYEYRKDAFTYIFFLALIYGFRYLRERSSGARYEVSQRAAPDVPEFNIKLAGKRRVIKATEVDWVEAAGNYLLLHVAGKTHPLRETMKQFEERFGEFFVRVHRSAIVNRNRIREIRTSSGNAKEILLESGDVVPCGRSYQASAERSLSMQGN